VALERQIELAMDAMQASHDTMIGHMLNVRQAMGFEPLQGDAPEPKPGEPTDIRPEPQKTPPKTKKSEGNGTQVAATLPKTGQEGAAPLSMTPDQFKDLMDRTTKARDMEQRARALGKVSETDEGGETLGSHLDAIHEHLMQIAGDVQMMPGAGYPWQVRRSPEETAKLKTHETLSKALGGGGAKVLPIQPGEEK
jgi:hypothetical protein